MNRDKSKVGAEGGISEHTRFLFFRSWIVDHAALAPVKLVSGPSHCYPLIPITHVGDGRYSIPFYHEIQVTSIKADDLVPTILILWLPPTNRSSFHTCTQGRLDIK